MISRSTLLAGVGVLVIAGVGTIVAVKQSAEPPSSPLSSQYRNSTSPIPTDPPYRDGPYPSPSLPFSDSQPPNSSTPVWRLTPSQPALPV